MIGQKNWVWINTGHNKERGEGMKGINEWRNRGDG
jgi:hypothetical protein